jgi:Tol biopolymer transport system component
MPFGAGQQLLHYRLVEQIGEGGMGVVWRATDTTLDRDAAIKVLPAEFAADAGRLARFEREARLLATLNHPNVAAIYGLHEANGVRFIAMELVGGEDLSQRIARGPLPVAEALGIASQIAEGLSAAHEAGVIHRDLKPANVKLTEEGKVKVLDFGLAKSHERASASGPETLEHSPTVTTAGTMAGMILGTAAYMSPEQARGKPLDRRTDIWSFGALLFEMLTGRQPFPGEAVSDVLAKILEREPAWDELPDRMHPGVRRLLERCLTKHPENRLRDAADVRIEIEHLLSDPRGEQRGASIDDAARAAPTPAWQRLLPWALLALMLAWVVAKPLMRPAAEAERLLHFELQPPAGHTFLELEVAPDGSAVAFVAADADGDLSLWVRRLDEPEARQLPGTEDATHIFPFWSPDTRSIAFFSGGKLRRVTLAGGSVQTIADAPNGRGGAWHPDGTILFTPDGADGLYTVPASGGEPVAVTTLQEEEFSHRFPHFVGDSRKFVFHAHSPDTAKIRRRYFGSLDSQELIPLPDGFSELYAPPGRALYIRERTLLVQDFDPATGELSGDPFPLANDVLDSEPVVGRSQFSVSNNGVLAYLRTPVVETRIDALPRGGGPAQTIVQSGDFTDPILSHDGKKILYTKHADQGKTLWLLDLERASTRRLLETETESLSATWSSDDRSVYYCMRDKLYRLPVAGGESQLVFDAAADAQATSLVTMWQVDASPDGSVLAFTGWDPVSDLDLWILPLDGESGVQSLARAAGQQQNAAISPNARWIAYDSEESGRTEVYVRSAEAGADEQWLVSANGGNEPVWSADGTRLYYYGAEEKAMMVVAVDPGASRFTPGLPAVAMAEPRGAVSFVGMDGERFLVQVAEGEVGEKKIEVVVNWESLVGQ